MLVDLIEYPEGLTVDADLCIIGAGAAGITIAQRFAGTNTSLCLLESGGMEFERDTQNLYLGERDGHAHQPLDTTRLRFFGGTTNHWTGQCAPLGADDFAVKPWVPHSGWPIDGTELEPYYSGAREICGLGTEPFDSGLWRVIGRSPLATDPAKLVPYALHYSARLRFAGTYRELLERTDNIRVLLHANVTEIVATENATRIDHVALSTLGGIRGKVRAKHFVLCCGGIENARLLLLSNSVERAGLGNRHDLVGRFFMDHTICHPAAIFAVEDPKPLSEAYGEHEALGRGFRLSLALSPALKRLESVLGCGVQVWPKSDWTPDADAKRGGGAFGRDVIADLNRLWRRVWPSFDDGPAANAFDLVCVGEQAPNPESRVTLSDQRDSLGLRRARLTWRLTEREARTIRSAVATTAAELGRLGIARVRAAEWLAEPGSAPLTRLEDYNHHMGTTRMAANPRRGVVDADCRVHGLANLFVAGSSVFPTAGYVNPTLTIAALALRLSDHLRQALQKG